ncbi:MAG: hypothetical protein M5U34_36005 [Chloroflexi bacterium]|nr:hypothetical protein [Chloroflexota bacterium]
MRLIQNPIEAVFRLDGGFASRENIYWLIEMGYEVYTRGRSTTVRDALSAAVTPETTWERVGGNASLTAWANTTVDDYFLSPAGCCAGKLSYGQLYSSGDFTPFWSN